MSTEHHTRPSHGGKWNPQLIKPRSYPTQNSGELVDPALSPFPLCLRIADLLFFSHANASFLHLLQKLL
jgi:hypothetical protein